jgi:PKD repeat protein
MMGMKRGRTAVCAVIGTIAMLAPGVAQAGTWLPPVPVNVSTGSDPSVALDATGNSLVTWRTNPGAGADVVQGAHHLVGATGFLALPPFSTDTAPADSNLTPFAVTNRSGNGLVVWVDEGVGNLHQVQLRTIAPDGTAGPVVGFPTGGPISVTMSNPTAAIDANGDAVVAWEQNGGIYAVTRQGLNNAFPDAPAPHLVTATATSPPSAAIDGSGNAIVVWESGMQIQAMRHSSGGAWSGTTDAVVPPGVHVYSHPALAANPIGQMVVPFLDFDGTNQAVAVVTGSVSGGWGTTPTVTALSPTGVTHGPAVNVDDSGGAAVGWSTTTGAQVSLRPAGGSFPAPAGAQSITPVPTTPGSFALAGNGAGAVVVAWSSFETTPLQNVVRAAVKPAGTSTFTATQIISDTATYAASPAIALDENGDAVVAYQLGATPAGIATAVYDGAGPLLGTPTVPATAVQGTAATFSVPQPLDAFSAVGSVKWSFGDGTADATGAQVSHAYSAPSTFKVTVTATDAVGNASSATRNIVVTAAPPPAAKCKVPKLKGKSLSKAKSLLKKSHCKLGKVTKPKKRKHHKLGKLVVKSSSPKAGATKPAGTKVALRLAQKKHTKKKK